MPHENGTALADRLLPPDDPAQRGARTLVKDILRTLADHNARAIPLKAELLDAYQIVAARLMQSAHESVQVASLKLILGAVQSNVALYQAADKIARLDGGYPTENVRGTVKLEFDRAG